MKVGTDGVLLGAWAGRGNPKRILDIGTGTGLIALQLAQRFVNARVVAIEPNASAFKDAQHNFEISPFASGLTLDMKSLADFRVAENFDLIVCNPPFYVDALDSPDSGRAQARSSIHLEVDELVGAIRLLNDRGAFAVIYPPEAFRKFEWHMNSIGFNAGRILKVKPTPEKEVHRILGEFSRESKVAEEEVLIIEKYGRHGYGEEYIELTKNFYLNIDSKRR